MAFWAQSATLIFGVPAATLIKPSRIKSNPFAFFLLYPEFAKKAIDPKSPRLNAGGFWGVCCSERIERDGRNVSVLPVSIVKIPKNYG